MSRWNSRNTTPLPAKVYANEGACQFLFLQGNEPCEVSYADRAGKYMGQRGRDAAEAVRGRLPPRAADPGRVRPEPEDRGRSGRSRHRYDATSASGWRASAPPARADAEAVSRSLRRRRSSPTKMPFLSGGFHSLPRSLPTSRSAEAFRPARRRLGRPLHCCSAAPSASFARLAAPSVARGCRPSTASGKRPRARAADVGAATAPPRSSWPTPSRPRRSSGSTSTRPRWTRPRADGNLPNLRDRRARIIRDRSTACDDVRRPPRHGRPHRRRHPYPGLAAEGTLMIVEPPPAAPLPTTCTRSDGSTTRSPPACVPARRGQAGGGALGAQAGRRGSPR